jgi:hypothetical protein
MMHTGVRDQLGETPGQSVRSAQRSRTAGTQALCFKLKDPLAKALAGLDAGACDRSGGVLGNSLNGGVFSVGPVRMLKG